MSEHKQNDAGVVEVEFQGPDEDGNAFVSVRWSDGKVELTNLGPAERAAEAAAEWLSRIDFGE